MAREVKSFRLDAQEDALLKQLCDILEEPNESDALRLIFRKGLHELQWQAAVHLYTSTPQSTGEIADRVGWDRGTLLRLLQEHRIRPWEPELPAEQVTQALEQESHRQLADWPRPHQ